MTFFSGVAVDIAVPALVLTGVVFLDRIAFPLIGPGLGARRAT
ncbi:hypothetical protein [Ensifer soli]